MIEAGIDGDAREPVFEWNSAAELIEFAEHFQKNLLDKVLRIFAAREVGANDLSGQWVEMFNQLGSGGVIALAQARHEGRERLQGVRHSIRIASDRVIQCW